MRFPMLTLPATVRRTQDMFLGLNRNPCPGEGEFSDMENLSSDGYPLLTTRPKRGLYAAPAAASGLIAKDSLCYCSGGDFVMGGYHVDMKLSDAPKSMVSMGAYVIILPDKKYVNTADLSDFGNLEAEITGDDPTFTPASLDGEDRIPAGAGPVAPESPSPGQLWVDTSGSTPVLMAWSETAGMWVEEASSYVRIQSPGIGKPFREYDGVTLSGPGVAGTALEGATVIWGRGDDYILVPGLLPEMQGGRGAVTVKRTVPDMDFVIESENRLWGCRYGLNREGKFVNELYASKLGDFKNWNCFMGLSTDSYVVSLGSDGVFTGAVNYLGYPLFFKENCIHRVYGSYPAAYRLQTTPCRGVRKGSEKSLAMVGEVLYYHAAGGICAYDGSLPVGVSTALGQEEYREAVAGALGEKYYVSMLDAQGEPGLYVYDTRRGLWHREDGTRAKEFCACRRELYFLDEADGKIKTVLGSGTQEEPEIRWFAQTGPIGATGPDNLYLSRLTVQLSLDAGGSAGLEVEYDGSGVWEPLGKVACGSLRRFTLPVRPRRCGFLRLRLFGVGSVKIYALTKTLESGSDVT